VVKKKEANSFDLNELLSEIEDKISVEINKDAVWREKPVDLITFFGDEKYLGENLYPKQKEIMGILDKLIRYKVLKESDKDLEKLEKLLKDI